MEMVLVDVVSRGTGGLPCALLGDDLDLFRREIEPMARRLIELCGPDWFCNLL